MGVLDRDLMKSIVVMGVSGCGKSTLGQLLAKKTGGIFLDGDDFHPPENVAKMKSGIPLTNEDRQGWLESLAREIHSAGKLTIIACSALKASYREILSGAEFVFLSGPEDLIAERLAARENHYMPPGLLKSQLDTLEPPDQALVLDIRRSPEDLANEVISKFELQPTAISQISPPTPRQGELP